MPDDMKSTLYFDSTQRSKIDGDWLCLIFIFTNNLRFSLTPLFFAYEDRENIVRLIVETYIRLALTITSTNQAVSAKDLWEKITAIMTNSVTKNLKIEDGVADVLKSNYRPYHLLCKFHPVLDRSNIEVLSTIENQLNFSEKLESIIPSVRSFLCGEKCVTVCGIKSILNLISHDKSASSTSQAFLFDFVLRRDNQVKHRSLYQERRFTKLGYSAASILDALPYLRILLNESHLTKHHIEIVRMFLDSEFFITELSVLVFFTHKVSSPLLNFVEISSQEELLRVFPKLYEDLQKGKMDTLEQYSVKYCHIVVSPPTNESETLLLESMCLNASKSMMLQCGRQCGFADKNEPARETQLIITRSVISQIKSYQQY